ncbi:MAG: glycosyltransferase family A protein [Saprospiraceae bacterium]
MIFSILHGPRRIVRYLINKFSNSSRLLNPEKFEESKAKQDLEQTKSQPDSNQNQGFIDEPYPLLNVETPVEAIVETSNEPEPMSNILAVELGIDLIPHMDDSEDKEAVTDIDPLENILISDSNMDSVSTQLEAEMDHHKIHFFIEQLDELDFHFILGGWIFGESHIITKLTLFVSQDNEERYFELYYGTDRVDVYNHYHLKNATRSGFIESIEKSFNGRVHISLIVAFSDGYKLLIKLGEFQFRPPFLQEYKSMMDSNRAIFYSESQLKKHNEKKVAVYSKVTDNLFTGEVKALLIRGLQSLGYEVLSLDESSGFYNDAFLHIIIAPHEFYGSGLNKKYFFRPSNRLILYNTEQVSAEWFRIRNSYFAQCIEIWDMNYSSWQRLSRVLDHVHYLPVGHIESSILLGEVPVLPDNYFTCFLDKKVRENSFLNSDFEYRPIDILFIGHTSWRRQQFFVDHAAFFAKYNCVFHLTNLSHGPFKQTIANIDLTTLIGLSQRSKIILNIHHGILPYFEWHRMIPHGIWQKSLIITERCDEAPPFIPGKDFIQASLENIPGIIEHYLDSKEGNIEANKIIQSAYNTLTTQADFVGLIRPLILSLESIQINTAEHIPGIGAGKAIEDEQIDIIFEQTNELQVEITVIITLYNYADLVVESLDSLLEQTHKKFDLVIVEDCSTDQSLNTAKDWLGENKSFFNSIQLIHNRENRGLGTSRNIAFRHATTPFVFVLDADNIIFPRALERLLIGLKNTDAALAYSYLEHFGGSEKLGGLRLWNPEVLTSENTIDAMVLMRKQTWEKAGGYAEDMPCNGWEDYEMGFKITEFGGWALRVPEILCRYRVHDTSMMRTVTSKKFPELVAYLKIKYPNFWHPTHLQQLRQMVPVIEEYKNTN